MEGTFLNQRIAAEKAVKQPTAKLYSPSQPVPLIQSNYDLPVVEHPAPVFDNAMSVDTPVLRFIAKSLIDPGSPDDLVRHHQRWRLIMQSGKYFRQIRVDSR